MSLLRLAPTMFYISSSYGRKLKVLSPCATEHHVIQIYSVFQEHLVLLQNWRCMKLHTHTSGHYRMQSPFPSHRRRGNGWMYITMWVHLCGSQTPVPHGESDIWRYSLYSTPERKYTKTQINTFCLVHATSYQYQGIGIEILELELFSIPLRWIKCDEWFDICSQF